MASLNGKSICLNVLLNRNEFGLSIMDCAKLVGVNYKTLDRWNNQLKDGTIRIEPLKNITTKPKILTDEVVSKIVDFTNENRGASLAEIKRYAQELTGRSLSFSAIRKAIKKYGFIWRNSKNGLPNQINRADIMKERMKYRDTILSESSDYGIYQQCPPRYNIDSTKNSKHVSFKPRRGLKKGFANGKLSALHRNCNTANAVEYPKQETIVTPDNCFNPSPIGEYVFNATIRKNMKTVSNVTMLHDDELTQQLTYDGSLEEALIELNPVIFNDRKRKLLPGEFLPSSSITLHKSVDGIPLVYPLNPYHSNSVLDYKKLFGIPDNVYISGVDMAIYIAKYYERTGKTIYDVLTEADLDYHYIAHKDKSRILYLDTDEAGISTDIIDGAAKWYPPKYDDAGSKYYDIYKSYSHSKNITLISTCTSDNRMFDRVLETGLTSSTYAEYIIDVIGPCVLNVVEKPVHITDNCTAHKGSICESLFNFFEIESRFRPPYSPDFAPPEMGWRIKKQAMQKIPIKNQQDLILAVYCTLDLINSDPGYVHSQYSYVANKLKWEEQRQENVRKLKMVLEPTEKSESKKKTISQQDILRILNKES